MSIQFRTRTMGFGVVPEELTGACCILGECTHTDLASCKKLGGTFVGPDTECKDDTCDLEGHGACCDKTGFCYYVTEEGCEFRGGVWHGEKTDCIDYDCCAGSTAAAQACCIGQWGNGGAYDWSG